MMKWAMLASYKCPMCNTPVRTAPVSRRDREKGEDNTAETGSTAR